jgi:hypothetical protein
VREKQTITERITGRSCAWCSSWITYSGSGRMPKYCKPGCRQRAYEVRTAEARRERDIAAGTATDAPVRETVNRTETVTRTVVRSGWPLMIPSDQATAQTSVAGAGGWAAVLQLLAARLRDGTVRQDEDWAELEAAFASLQAAMKDPASPPPATSGVPGPRVRQPEPRREVEPMTAAQWLVSLRALAVRLHHGDLRLVDDRQWPAVERELQEVAALADFTLPPPVIRPSPQPLLAAPGGTQESRQVRRQREREERKNAAKKRH